MRPSLELLDGETLVVDNSALEAFKACPRMFLYKHVYKRVRSGAAPARDAGKALHLALETRYLVAQSRAADADVEARMLARLHEGFAGVEMPMDEYRTEGRFAEVLRAYNQFWGAEPFRVLGAEVPFATELGWVGKVRVVWQGRVDLVIQWDSGEVEVLDHKTMNSWNGSKLHEWENASGPKGYCWALSKLRELGQLDLPRPVTGFTLNALVIRKPDSGYGRSKLPREEFHRARFSYLPERIEEWRTNTLLWIETLLRYADSGVWPQNEKHCASYFGLPCPYLDVDSHPAEQRELVLGSDLYADYDWSPLKQEEAE